jgi:hypothetical protein
MPRIDAPGVLDTSERRLAALTADAARRWGTLTAHEMVCHLSDSFRGILGDRPVTPARMSAVQRQLTRIIALHTPLPWPKGLPTRPEVDPRQLGTQPAAFEDDRAQLRELMRRFAGPGATYVEHPIFGALSHREWMIWAYRHVDHHFRQFGI